VSSTLSLVVVSSDDADEAVDDDDVEDDDDEEYVFVFGSLLSWLLSLLTFAASHVLIEIL